MTGIDIDAALASFRPQLLRFARLQLRNEAVAEDVVQDALLAAMEGASGFSGASALKTWVFSILRNKIIDEIRRRVRGGSQPFDEEAGEADLEGMFFTWWTLVRNALKLG